MKWAYDLTGAEPIIKDEPVYDGASIAYGELLMLGAAAYSAGTNAGISFVTAAPDTVGGTQAVNALGISLEAKTTGDSPSVATAWNTTAATGGCYAKCIINPFAVYRAEVNTADALAIASSASTDEFACTGVGDDSLNGQWVFFAASGGPNHGELRRIVDGGAASTVTMDNAVGATITTADTFVTIAPKNTYSNILDDTATMVSQTSVGGNTADNLRVVESYVSKERGQGPYEILGPEHNNVKLVGASYVKFYNDLMMKDHIFGAQE